MKENGGKQGVNKKALVAVCIVAFAIVSVFGVMMFLDETRSRDNSGWIPSEESKLSGTSGDGEDVLSSQGTPMDDDSENQATDVPSDRMTAQWVFGDSAESVWSHWLVKCPHCGSIQDYPYATCRACGKEFRITALTCPKCDGKTEFSCKHCQGKTIVCDFCKGKGFTIWENRDYITGGGKLLGTFKNRCGRCGGTGKLVCQTCKGTNRIQCKACMGRGNYPAIE